MLNELRLDSAIFAPAKISSNSIRHRSAILFHLKQVGTPLAPPPKRFGAQEAGASDSFGSPLI
jgi:hypothetical protein